MNYNYLVTIFILISGMVTTSRAMYALLAIFIEYPKVQSKVQEETDRIIGQNRARPQDKQNMPYTEAVLLELLR